MKFTELLMEKKPDVYRRLCECANTKEDALVDILEWLDSNSQWQLADLTKEEYDELKR